MILGSVLLEVAVIQHNFHEEASTLVYLEISKYPLAVLVVISDATGIAF